MGLEREASQTATVCTDGYSKAPAALEQGDLDVQELLRVLPKIANQQAHISGQTRQIVVELWVGKQFSRGGGVVIQLRGSRRNVGAGFAQLFVKSVVGYEPA